jgi:hypothetical protein
MNMHFQSLACDPKPGCFKSPNKEEQVRDVILIKIDAHFQ